MDEDEGSSLEQKKRVDAVLGIMLAAVLGFVLNVLANVYYAMFITHQTTWNRVDHIQLYGFGFVLVALLGFLDFFIYDYENKVEVNRSFLKRYLNYFFYSFTAGKVIRVIVGLYITFILIGFVVALYFGLAVQVGYILATLAAAVVAVMGYATLRRRR